MINLIRAAMRGVRAQMAAGDGGWTVAYNGSTLSNASATSNAGTSVSAQSVLQLSAAWSCVSVTSQLIASLPAAIYERQRDGSRKRIDPDIGQILTVKPNTSQTAFEMWEGLTAQQLLQGNGYMERLQVRGRLVGLRPLFNVTPKRLADGSFRYQITEAGRRRELGPDQVFHTRGFSAGDGCGLSAVRHGVHSLGSAIAAEQAAGSVFANGMAIGGFLKYEDTLSPDQRDQLQGQVSGFVGSKNTGKLMALEAGVEFQALSMNPEDVQLLETRRFQVEDICRWFGVPPIIIGHAQEGQTMWGTGVEAIMLAWLTKGINPMLRRLEARINADLIPADKRGRWKFKWNREAMLQMDSAAKAEFLSRMVTTGIMSPDESREKLNLARRGGAADELMAQTALAPLENLLKGSTE